MDLSDIQAKRYSRHIILKEIGFEGQVRLTSGSVLIVGCGGLGSPVAMYLASAGIGTIGLVDADNVDITNLQRQIVHFTPDVDKPKVESAEEKIRMINPDVKTVLYTEYLKATNAAEIIGKYDFVIDATDNFPAKYLINDACVMLKKPFSHAGILRFEGQTFTYTPGSTCLRCLFPEPPPEGVVPTCSQAGVLNTLPGVMGTIQATEAVKYISGAGDLLTDRVLMFDAMKMRFHTVSTDKDHSCPVCGSDPAIKELYDEVQKPCTDKKDV